METKLLAVKPNPHEHAQAIGLEKQLAAINILDLPSVQAEMVERGWCARCNRCATREPQARCVRRYFQTRLSVKSLSIRSKRDGRLKVIFPGRQDHEMDWHSGEYCLTGEALKSDAKTRCRLAAILLAIIPKAAERIEIGPRPNEYVPRIAS